MPQLPRPIERLANEFDVNLLIVNGLWEIHDPLNGPGSGTWFVQVFRSPLTVPEDVEATQIAYNKATGRPKFRSANDGTWSDWIDATAGGGSGTDLPTTLQDIADVLPNKGRILVGTGITWAAFDPAAFGDFLVSDPDATNGIDWFSMSDLGLNLVTAAGATDARAELGLVIGTDVQEYDDDLAAIAALTKAKGNIIVANGVDWVVLSAGIAGQYLTPDTGTATGYAWTDLPTTDPVDLSDYYTKEQANAAFQPLSTLLSGLVTLGLGTDAQILSTDGTTFKWIDTPAGVDLSNYYTKTEADATFQAKGSYLVAADLDPYLTSANATSTYQPLDSDLTAIAALTTTTFGRSLLTQTDATTARVALGSVIGTDVQAWSSQLDDIGSVGYGTTGQILSTDGTSFLWIDAPTGGSGGIASVVEDTSPQLGGDLDLNGHDITGTGNLNVIGSVTVSGHTVLDVTAIDTTVQAYSAALADWATKNSADYLTTSDAATTYQPVGSYLVASDLAPYLTSATAASTYATISSLSDYLTTTDAASIYQPAGAYLVASDLTPYLKSADAVSTYQPIDADLTAIAALTNTKGNIIVGSGTTWDVVGVGANDQILVADSSQTAGVKWSDDIATVAFVIDGGGAAITPGIKGDVAINFSGTIIEAQVLADQTGSIVVDLWKDTYANFPPDAADSITASTPLTISSGTKADDATLASWIKSITAGDILRYNVDSVASHERVTIILKIKKSH